MKKLITCMLSMILVIAIVIQPNVSLAKENAAEREVAASTVQASSNTKKELSTKKVKTIQLSMYTYSGYEMKVPKKLAKAKWIVSDKEMVKVTRIGKNGTQIGLDTSGKTGKCTIQAKLKGKVKYKINLTIKKRIREKKYNGKKVKAGLINFSNRTWILTYRMYNGSNREVRYSTRRYLQKYVNGKWKNVNYPPDYVDLGIINYVPAHTSRLGYYRLSDYYDTSKLTPGTYRLYVHYSTKKKTDSFVKFKIK